MPEAPVVIGVRIAVQTRCFAQPLKQAWHTAAQIGGDGVQIDARTELPPRELSETGARQIRKMLDDLNLRVGSVAFSTRRGYANPDHMERRLAATVEAMRLASSLASRTLVVAVGRVPDAHADDRRTLTDVLRHLAVYGERLGVQLAMQCPDAEPSDVSLLLGELPAGLVGVDVSPADLIHAGRRPREFVEALGPHVLHVFANDAVRGLGGAAAIDVELGRGSTDVPELLAALEEFDYRGWVTVERRNSTRTVQDCADAVAYLRSL
jgi:sugar phosphate isomerase/epimerase